MRLDIGFEALWIQQASQRRPKYTQYGQTVANTTVHKDVGGSIKRSKGASGSSDHHDCGTPHGPTMVVPPTSARLFLHVHSTPMRLY